MPPKDRRTTLATVAKSAGVSVATVSKVLNGRSDVGPATRALVETLLRQHQYSGRRPVPLRPAAATARVELLFPDPLSAYSTEVLQGVLEAAGQGPTSVAVAIGAPGRTHRPSWARDLAAAGRQAVITVVNDLSDGDMRALARARLPLVVVDPSRMPQSLVPSVGSTNFAGGHAVAQHLLALGHRRIAFVGGPPTAAHNQARVHGLRAALEAVGAAVGEEYVRPGEPNIWHGHYGRGMAGGSTLLALPEPPTAIFAANDVTAAGVIEAARLLGLRVPGDLSVVGFDDTEVARFTSPPLTTVRQPLREIGAMALRTALRLAGGEKLDSHHVELATELVVRHSTAAPATR